MLSRIEVQNYRSLLDVKVNLVPFTLVIGANGSGKSNFLRLIRDLANVNLGLYTPKISYSKIYSTEAF